MLVLKIRKVQRLCMRLVILCVLGFVVVCYKFLIVGSRCSEADSKQILQTLAKISRKRGNITADRISLLQCYEFKRGRILGNLCSSLCTSHAIRYNHCLNYPDGKKIFVATWGNRTVIIKTKKPYINQYDPLGYMGPKGYILPSLSTLQNMVRDSMSFNLGINSSKSQPDLVRHMWPLNLQEILTKYDSVSERKAAMESFWSLIQQDEYVLMYYFRNSRSFPNIYGTCGHFYIMEYAPPGRLLDPFMGLTLFPLTMLWGPNNWEERTQLAIGLLELLQTFEQDFHEQLHFCDMKGENFGVSDKFEVKAVDVDMALFENKLQSQFLSEVNCTLHEDCDFFDCVGWCDADQHKCDPRRVNNNLQSLCKKVFQSRVGNAYSGLLSGAPGYIEKQLQPLLEQCLKMGTLSNAFSSKEEQNTLFMKLQGVLLDIYHELRHKNANNNVL